MFQLDLKSRKSIYEQVVDNLKEMIISGVLKSGEKLPSVRELSRMLTVNPNTVQKAYRELERQGYVYTSSGLGTFAADQANANADPKKVAEVMERIQSEIAELFYLGVTPSEIRRSIRGSYEGKGGLEMIKVEKINKSFDGFQALKDLDININKGSIYGLVGTNGAGKTTIIKHITGVLLPDSGQITIAGQPVYDNLAILRKEWAIFPMTFISLFL